MEGRCPSSKLRSLTLKCEKEHDKLIGDTSDREKGGANKHKIIVQKRRLTYQGNDHKEAIEQLFEINEILPNMCENGINFDAEDFHRNIIIAALHEEARVEFIKRDGRDEDDVLDLLLSVWGGQNYIFSIFMF